jgi:hypothetical protein
LRVALTDSGFEKAQQINDAVFNDVDRVDEWPSVLNAASAPAADRFVGLNDNSLEYSEAVRNLEKFIREANEIRVNDWPEKEGMHGGNANRRPIGDTSKIRQQDSSACSGLFRSSLCCREVRRGSHR